MEISNGLVRIEICDDFPHNRILPFINQHKWTTWYKDGTTLSTWRGWGGFTIGGFTKHFRFVFNPRMVRNNKGSHGAVLRLAPTKVNYYDIR